MIKCTLVLIFIALLAANTQAAEIDFGLNYTMTEKPPNNVWYQQEFNHSIKSNDTGYQIGLRFNPWDNIYLTTGYKYLGEFDVSADFIAVDRVYYNWQKGGDAPPLSHLTGTGEVKGIYFKSEYHFSTGFFVTGGAWLHEADWHVSSPEEYRLKRFNPNKGSVNAPINKQHEANAKPAWSWIAGIGYKYKNVSVMAEIWDIERGGDYPTTSQGNAEVITLTYTHPI